MKARLIAQLALIGLGALVGIAGTLATGSSGPLWAGLAFAGIMGLFALLDYSGHQEASTALAVGLGVGIVASEIKQRSDRTQD